MLIKIGTRESELALWQANQVAGLLAEKGHATELVLIKSEGDIDLTTPIYKMGVQGVFTRALDIALLQQKIDIAVHSMKDVPTQLPEGVVQAAVLERGNHADLFVPNDKIFQEEDKISTGEELMNSIQVEEAEQFPFIAGTIATSSVRRKAQWLNRYPNQTVEDLRGNVNTRLRKLEESRWSGAIFAAAGLERIEKRPASAIELKWMLPAPAQGAIVVVCLEKNIQALEIMANLNHEKTDICVSVERAFLAALAGGCSTPISAHATIVDDTLFFKGSILSPDGKLKAEIEGTRPVNEHASMAENMARMILDDGGREIISIIVK